MVDLREWQPIETAPNDVVLVTDGGYVLSACQVDSRWFSGWSHGEIHVQINLTPTHWMHLPDFPANTEPPKPETPKPIVAGVSEELVMDIDYMRADTYLSVYGHTIIAFDAKTLARSFANHRIAERNATIAAMRPGPLLGEVRTAVTVIAQWPITDPDGNMDAANMALLAHALLAKLGDGK